MEEQPGKTILVVEDNLATLQALATLLGQEGYQVLTAPNGEVGLTLLRGGRRVDLIVLDMLMPVVDGWAFLKRLPAKGRPPIIISSSTNLTREWADYHRCQGFLRKPYPHESLLQEVRGCLGA